VRQIVKRLGADFFKGILTKRKIVASFFRSKRLLSDLCKERMRFFSTRPVIGQLYQPSESGLVVAPGLKKCQRTKHRGYDIGWTPCHPATLRGAVDARKGRIFAFSAQKRISAIASSDFEPGWNTDH